MYTGSIGSVAVWSSQIRGEVPPNSQTETLERRRGVGVEVLSSVSTGGVVGWTHESVGLEGGVVGCRGYLAGRGAGNGHAQKQSFVCGRRAVFLHTSEDGLRSSFGRKVFGCWSVRGPIARGAYQRPLPLPARVFGASRQPVRVGLKACASGRGFVMLSVDGVAIRLGRQQSGWLLSTGDGTWAGCCMCMAGSFHEARTAIPLLNTIAFALQSTLSARLVSFRLLLSHLVSLRPTRTRHCYWGRPCHGRACRSPHTASPTPSTTILSPRPPLSRPRP
jgi:hypothetical protein